MGNKEKNNYLLILKTILKTIKHIFIFIIMFFGLAWKTLCELAKKY